MEERSPKDAHRAQCPQWERQGWRGEGQRDPVCRAVRSTSLLLCRTVGWAGTVRRFLISQRKLHTCNFMWNFPNLQTTVGLNKTHL